jgi:cell division septation protein DedD
MADDFRSDVDDRIASTEPSYAVTYSRRGRRIMTGLVAVAAVLGFAVVLVYAYNKGKQGSTGGTPPVIQPQEGPSKIRPENPGGMKVPNRDKEVFTRLETDKQTGGVERLLPPPEDPMAPPAPSPGAVQEEFAKMAPSASTGGNVAVPLKLAIAPPPAAPKEIQSLSVTPPKSLATPPGAKKSPPPPKKTDAKTPAKKSKSVAKPKTASTTVAYRVQIASLRSRAAVQKNWATLKRQHSDLLGKLGLSIQSVKLSGGRGTYYRMQAGPITSKSRATALCSSLKKRKQVCIVVRR